VERGFYAMTLSTRYVVLKSKPEVGGISTVCLFFFRFHNNVLPTALNITFSGGPGIRLIDADPECQGSHSSSSDLTHQSNNTAFQPPPLPQQPHHLAGTQNNPQPLVIDRSTHKPPGMKVYPRSAGKIAKFQEKSHTSPTHCFNVLLGHCHSSHHQYNPCRGSSIGRACGSYNSKEINLKVVGSSPTFGYSYITSSTEQLFFYFFAGRSFGK
jgi:hypothetical protein